MSWVSRVEKNKKNKKISKKDLTNGKRASIIVEQNKVEHSALTVTPVVITVDTSSFCTYCANWVAVRRCCIFVRYFFSLGGV